MKPQEISLELKFTREMKDGVWRGIQVGAVANLEPDETLKEGIARLYPQLSEAGSMVWGHYHKKSAQQAKVAQAVVGDEEIDEPPAPQVPTPPEEPESPPNWCEIHDCEMKRHTGKTGGAWYSHQTIDDESGLQYWCRGKPRKLCSVHGTMMDQRDWGGFSHRVGNAWCHGEVNASPRESSEEEMPF